MDKRSRGGSTDLSRVGKEAGANTLEGDFYRSVREDDSGTKTGG